MNKYVRVILIFERRNIFSKKNISLSFKNNNLLLLKKLSIYSLFCWLLILNISPLAKLVNNVYLYVSSVVVILPLFFIFDKIYKEKGFKSYNKYLLMFLLISTISCLVNFHGFPANIKRVIWTSIYILFIFSDDDLHEVVDDIKWIFSMFMFISSLISVGMFFVQYKEQFFLDNQIVRIGFVENRLFGMYFDPNYASTAAILCFYLCIQKIQGGKNEIFSLINMIVQFIYMTLSNSRTCQVSLCISFAFLCFMFFYKKRSLNSNTNNNVLFMSLIYSILYSVFLFILLKFTSYVLVETSNILNFYLNSGNSNVSLTRIDIEHSHEYSNGRFAIWLDALEIFKKNWIIGISPGYVTKYAEQFFPDGIIARNHYIGMHNSAVDTLVSVGIFGFLFLTLFLSKFIISIVKLFISKSKILYEFEFAILISSILSILLSSLFVSEIVFFCKVSGFLFWLFLSEIRRKMKKENI